MPIQLRFVEPYFCPYFFRLFVFILVLQANFLISHFLCPVPCMEHRFIMRRRSDVHSKHRAMIHHIKKNENCTMMVMMTIITIILSKMVKNSWIDMKLTHWSVCILYFVYFRWKFRQKFVHFIFSLFKIFQQAKGALDRSLRHSIMKNNAMWR